MKFNEKLIELRKKAGLSQEQLGDKLNVSRQTISKWELGETTPELEKLIKLSKIFNVSLDELAGEEEQKEDEMGKINKKKSIIKKILIIILLLILIYAILVVRRLIIVNKLFKDIEKLSMDGYEVTSKAENSSMYNINPIKFEESMTYVKGESISVVSEGTYDEKGNEIEKVMRTTYTNENTSEQYTVYCDEDGNTIKEKGGVKYVNYIYAQSNKDYLMNRFTSFSEIYKMRIIFDIFTTRLSVSDFDYNININTIETTIRLRYSLDAQGSLYCICEDNITGEKSSYIWEYMPIYDNFEEGAIEQPDIEGVQFEIYDYNLDEK